MAHGLRGMTETQRKHSFVHIIHLCWCDMDLFVSWEPELLAWKIIRLIGTRPAHNYPVSRQLRQHQKPRTRCHEWSYPNGIFTLMKWYSENIVLHGNHHWRRTPGVCVIFKWIVSMTGHYHWRRKCAHFTIKFNVNRYQPKVATVRSLNLSRGDAEFGFDFKIFYKQMVCLIKTK